MVAEGDSTYDVFVSYRWVEPDQVWVRDALVPALRAAGLRVCLDVDDFLPGRDLINEMDRAITESRHTLCVLSPEYFEGRMVAFETQAAQRLDPTGSSSRLIPFSLREAPQAPEWVRGRVAVDWLRPDDRRREWTRLLRFLNAANPDAPLPVSPESRTAVMQPIRRSYATLRQEQVLHGTGDELFSVAFSPDDRLIAGGSDGQILVWDRDRGDPPRSLTGHEDYVYSVAFSHKGDLIASGAEDRQVRLWDVQPGQMLWSEQAHEEAVYSVAFSPDDSLLASGSYDRTVRLWDVRTGQLQRESDATLPRNGRVSSVAFSPDDSLLAVGRLDNTVTLWNLQTGDAYPLDGHGSSVEAIAFSPDGKLLASGGLDKSVIVWDVERGVMKWHGRGHEYLVRSVAFSPDGATVASASWDKTVRLWDSETGRPIRQLPFDRRLPWHTDWIWSVAFSKTMTLATGGSDSQLILWSVGEERQPPA